MVVRTIGQVRVGAGARAHWTRWTAAASGEPRAGTRSPARDGGERARPPWRRGADPRRSSAPPAGDRCVVPAGRAGPALGRLGGGAWSWSSSACVGLWHLLYGDGRRAARCGSASRPRPWPRDHAPAAALDDHDDVDDLDDLDDLDARRRPSLDDADDIVARQRRPRRRRASGSVDDRVVGTRLRSTPTATVGPGSSNVRARASGSSGSGSDDCRASGSSRSPDRVIGVRHPRARTGRSGGVRLRLVRARRFVGLRLVRARSARDPSARAGSGAASRTDAGLVVRPTSTGRRRAGRWDGRGAWRATSSPPTTASASGTSGATSSSPGRCWATEPDAEVVVVTGLAGAPVVARRRPAAGRAGARPGEGRRRRLPQRRDAVRRGDRAPVPPVRRPRRRATAPTSSSSTATPTASPASCVDGLDRARAAGAATVLGLRDILDEPAVVAAELAGDGWRRRRALRPRARVRRAGDVRPRRRVRPAGRAGVLRLGRRAVRRSAAASTGCSS